MRPYSAHFAILGGSYAILVFIIIITTYLHLQLSIFKILVNINEKENLFLYVVFEEFVKKKWETRFEYFFVGEQMILYRY